MRFDVDMPTIEARDEQRKTLGSWKCSLSAKDLVRVEYRAIDTRPCEPLMAADVDWGEVDSIANVPRSKSPAWVRAITTTTEPGDA